MVAVTVAGAGETPEGVGLKDRDEGVDVLIDELEPAGFALEGTRLLTGSRSWAGRGWMDNTTDDRA